MTRGQMAITFALVAAATVTTRFLPYVLFPEGRKVPAVITYLGKVLGPAVFGLLVVYCLRHVSLAAPSHGIPELIACLVTIGLYVWKRNMILPMAGGTLTYMLLLRLFF